ncbi:hypothetical protein pb186bvf_007067 [Paramecium bursaria]
MIVVCRNITKNINDHVHLNLNISYQNCFNILIIFLIIYTHRSMTKFIFVYIIFYQITFFYKGGSCSVFTNYLYLFGIQHVIKISNKFQYNNISHQNPIFIPPLLRQIHLIDNIDIITSISISAIIGIRNKFINN